MNSQDNDNISNLSIDEIANMFGKIYFSTQNYGQSGEYLLIRLVRAIGASTKSTYRYFNEDQAIRSLSKIFAWYFAVINRYSITTSEILWSKYPAHCPRCLKNNCECTNEVNAIDDEGLALKALEYQSKKPIKLDDWQNMFYSIYTPKPETASHLKQGEVISSIYSRIFEEIAEVSEVLSLDEYCHKDKLSFLKNELADVIAWVFSLLNTLNYYQNNKKYMAAELLRLHYNNSCSRCNETRCVCIKGDFAIELSSKGVIGLSHYDKMLGIANSSALDLFLKKHNKDLYYCLFIDIDNFGLVNKTYGHEIGDVVLKAISGCMQRTFIVNKFAGSIFRKGGEEFVIMIIGHTEDDAYFMAEDIRRLINGLNFDHLFNSDKKVSVSIGISHNDTSSNDPSLAINEADAYMRQAKQEGKNTIRPENQRLEEIIQKKIGDSYNLY